MSGALFNFAIDPLLWSLSKLAVNPDIGRILACADDIAAAMRHLWALKQVFAIFQEFQQVSGLCLHPGKCVLVLTSVKVNPETVGVVRNWLSQNIPAWEAMNISNVGTYLGIALGPDSRDVLWKDALRKFHCRVKDINRCKLPPLFAIRAYNAKVATVLGYIGQFAAPPEGLVKIELGATNSILRFATNSLSTGAVNFLRKELAINLTPVATLLKAVAIRASRQTFQDVEFWHQWLADAANECLPMSLALQGVFTPPGWSSESVVEYAFKASGLKHIPNNTRVSIEWAIENAPAARIPNVATSIQKVVMIALTRTLSCEFESLVVRRLSVLCPGFVFNVPQTIAKWAILLKGKSLSIKVIALRSLVNSWTTSYRFHEPVLLSCVFGCSRLGPFPRNHLNCRDELSHYLVCRPLWQMVSEIINIDMTIMKSPERLGVGRVCNVEGIVMAHHMYHFVKHSRWDDVVRCRTLVDIERLREAAFRFGVAARG